MGTKSSNKEVDVGMVVAIVGLLVTAWNEGLPMEGGLIRQIHQDLLVYNEAVQLGLSNEQIKEAFCEALGDRYKEAGITI